MLNASASFPPQPSLSMCVYLITYTHAYTSIPHAQIIQKLLKNKTNTSPSDGLTHKNARGVYCYHTHRAKYPGTVCPATHASSSKCVCVCGRAARFDALVRRVPCLDIDSWWWCVFVCCLFYFVFAAEAVFLLNVYAAKSLRNVR